MQSWARRHPLNRVVAPTRFYLPMFRPHHHIRLKNNIAQAMRVSWIMPTRRGGESLNIGRSAPRGLVEEAG
jgi:hypothetical protein